MTTYITTPIYYLNGDPHLGHAYTSIIGDVLKKAAHMRGEEVFYTTGTDEHGQKNQNSIESSNLAPEAFLDQQSEKFRTLFERLGIDFDYFVRTSNPEHKASVTYLLDMMHQKGALVKKNYTGMYCVGCEQFKKPRDLDEDGNCPDHKVAPKMIDEENYFLKLEPYREWLLEHIEKNPDWIQPEDFKKTVVGMLQEPLDDLCISRPKDRVWLGVDLPFDQDYVTYIWYDALTNYISNLGWPKEDNRMEECWTNSTHLIGKDIIKPHCIYWPIMLKAAGLEPPSKVLVHGYWLGEGNIKMSKSIGNVVEPNKVIDEVGSDAMRFYLLNAMFGCKDSQVSENLIKNTYRNLANNIGNLHMRGLKMTEKYFEGTIPECDLGEEDLAFLNGISSRFSSSVKNMKTIDGLSEHTNLVLKVGSELNTYIESKQPWRLSKDSGQRPALASTLYTVLEGTRLIGVALSSVMPNTSSEIIKTLGLPETKPSMEDLSTPKLKAGDLLGEAKMLFPRLAEDIIKKSVSKEKGSLGREMS